MSRPGLLKSQKISGPDRIEPDQTEHQSEKIATQGNYTGNIKTHCRMPKNVLKSLDTLPYTLSF